MSESDFVEVVRRGVEELAALDSSKKVFGASSHAYRFATPYPDDALATFEREAGVQLPADYRAFITRVGNGGAGPAYGVIGFQAEDDEDYTDYAKLGMPWPYAEAYNPTELLDEGQSSYFQAFDSTGALYVCHHGCASRSLLIVTGPCRGQIWSDEVANDGGYEPRLLPSGDPMTFRDWYLEWLEQSLAKLRSG